MNLDQRNEKWRIMADRLKWPATLIGLLCNASERTVELGVKAARAKATEAKSNDEADNEPLTENDRRYLDRRYHSADDPEVRDFLRFNNSRHRRRP